MLPTSIENFEEIKIPSFIHMIETLKSPLDSQNMFVNYQNVYQGVTEFNHLHLLILSIQQKTFFLFEETPVTLSLEQENQMKKSLNIVFHLIKKQFPNKTINCFIESDQYHKTIVQSETISAITNSTFFNYKSNQKTCFHFIKEMQHELTGLNIQYSLLRGIFKIKQTRHKREIFLLGLPLKTILTNVPAKLLDTFSNVFPTNSYTENQKVLDFLLQTDISDIIHPIFKELIKKLQEDLKKLTQHRLKKISHILFIIYYCLFISTPVFVYYFNGMLYLYSFVQLFQNNPIFLTIKPVVLLLLKHMTNLFIQYSIHAFYTPDDSQIQTLFLNYLLPSQHEIENKMWIKLLFDSFYQQWLYFLQSISTDLSYFQPILTQRNISIEKLTKCMSIILTSWLNEKQYKNKCHGKNIVYKVDDKKLHTTLNPLIYDELFFNDIISLQTLMQMLRSNTDVSIVFGQNAFFKRLSYDYQVVTKIECAYQYSPYIGNISTLGLFVVNRSFEIQTAGNIAYYLSQLIKKQLVKISKKSVLLPYYLHFEINPYHFLFSPISKQIRSINTQILFFDSTIYWCKYMLLHENTTATNINLHNYESTIDQWFASFSPNRVEQIKITISTIYNTYVEIMNEKIEFVLKNILSQSFSSVSINKNRLLRDEFFNSNQLECPFLSKECGPYYIQQKYLKQIDMNSTDSEYIVNTLTRIAENIEENPSSQYNVISMFDNKITTLQQNIKSIGSRTWCERFAAFLLKSYMKSCTFTYIIVEKIPIQTVQEFIDKVITVKIEKIQQEIIKIIEKHTSITPIKTLLYQEMSLNTKKFARMINKFIIDRWTSYLFNLNTTHSSFDFLQKLYLTQTIPGMQNIKHTFKLMYDYLQLFEILQTVIDHRLLEKIQNQLKNIQVIEIELEVSLPVINIEKELVLYMKSQNKQDEEIAAFLFNLTDKQPLTTIQQIISRYEDFQKKINLLLSYKNDDFITYAWNRFSEFFNQSTKNSIHIYNTAIMNFLPVKCSYHMSSQGLDDIYLTYIMNRKKGEVMKVKHVIPLAESPVIFSSVIIDTVKKLDAYQPLQQKIKYYNEQIQLLEKQLQTNE